MLVASVDFSVISIPFEFNRKTQRVIWISEEYVPVF